MLEKEIKRDTNKTSIKKPGKYLFNDLNLKKFLFKNNLNPAIQTIDIIKTARIILNQTK